MDSGCHRARVSNILTGEQNVLRAGFSTMKATRIPSATTSLSQFIGVEGDLLWVGTENGGLNLVNFRQEQFGSYRHRPSDPNSLSPGKVTAIYEEPSDIL